MQSSGGNIEQLPLPKKQKVIKADQSGYLEKINSETVGVAGLIIQAGRKQITDLITPETGIEFHVKIGDSVSINDPLFTLHGNDENILETAVSLLKSSVVINKNKINNNKLIAKVLN